jgi:hypothetical protein
VSGALQARGGAPVPSATLTLSGASTRTATSTASGAVHVQRRAGGRLAAHPRKTGDLRGAVTSLDAAWILQAVAQLRTLDAQQRLAADVTGDGTISALDATLILQRAVGLNTAFAAATACASDWLFVPNATAVPNQSVVPPSVSSGTCVMGSLTYGPLTATANGQSFTGVLLGDVTGNWQ